MSPTVCFGLESTYLAILKQSPTQWDDKVQVENLSGSASCLCSVQRSVNNKTTQDLRFVFHPKEVMVGLEAATFKLDAVVLTKLPRAIYQYIWSCLILELIYLYFPQSFHLTVVSVL